MNSKMRFFVIPASLGTLALAGSAYGAWIVPCVVGSNKVTVDKTSKVVVENYLVKNGNEESNPYSKFVDLAAAIKSANEKISSGLATNVHVYVVSGSSVLVQNKSLVLNSGVSLYLPYEGRTVFTDTEGDYKGYISKSNSDSSSGDVASNRKCLVQFENTTLSIKQGAELYIGGEIGTRGVVRYYSELLLDANSNINCDGSIYAYGYIKEKNPATSNQSGDEEKIKNECDPNRYVIFNDGSYLMTSLGIDDTSSGGTLYTLVNSNICPFNVFDFRNIQTYAKFSNGAKMQAKARLVIGSGDSATYVSQDVTIIDKKGNSALFQTSASTSIKDNFLSLEYCPLNSGYTSADASPTKAILNENVDLGSLVIKSAKTIDTSDYYLPMSYKIHCTIMNGAQFDLKNKIKFMPGSKLKVSSGGKLINDSSMVVFPEGALDDALGGVGNTFKGKTSADFCVNGSFVSNKGSSYGGYIRTDDNTGKPNIDFSAITSQSSLTVTSNEGTNQYEAKATASGLFEKEDGSVESGNFKAGTIVTSSASQNAWKGDYFNTKTLSVKIDLSDKYEYNVANYQVFEADSASGANSIELTSGTTKKDDTFDLKAGKYVKISVIRAKSAYLSDGTALSSDTWYLVNDNFEVLIHPNKGVAINLYTQNKSGAATTKYSITENGTNYKEEITANGQVILIENKQFTFKVENTGLGKTSYDQAYIAKGKGDHFSDSITAEQYCTQYGLTDMKKIDKTYSGIADEVYTIFTTRAEVSSCLLSNSIVLMADGSYKCAGDIKTGDVVISFNHETGRLEPNVVIGNDDIDKPADRYSVVHLEFSNGKSTDFVYEHGYFDATLNHYVYMHENDATNFVGHEFVFAEKNLKVSCAKLINVSVREKFTKLAAPATANHLNLIVDNMLSMEGGLSGLFNIFEYDPSTLAFDKKKMDEDIQRYGLLGYESFEKYFPKEIYDLLPCKYLGVSIGKGLITWDVFEGYVNQWKDQLMENVK